MKSTSLRLRLAAFPLLSAMVLTGCVSQSDYDKVQAENSALRQQVAASKAEVSRLQGAIKYTAESDLLFKPGGWEISEGGKKIIAALAAKLAPTAKNRILVAGYTDNTPVGPGLISQGVTSNQVLSEKRADNVMQFLISQGLNPQLVTAKGFGDADPVASNDTPADRAKNRRVELSLIDGSTG